MRFGNGSLIGGSGSLVFGGAVVTEMLNNNALSLHGQDPNNNQTSQEFIEKVSQAKIESLGTLVNVRDLPDSERTASRLPAEIQSGSTGWQFLFVNGGFDDGEPNRTGTYVIRHNLPGTYSIAATNMTLGASTTVDVNGVSMTRIEVTNIQQTNVWFDVTGPVGAFPTDWDIQFLRASDEAAFDDTSKEVWEAERVFIPEFLARRLLWKPHHERFMKAMRTETSPFNSLAEYPGPNSRVFRQCYPIEFAVGLCNYVGMGGWFNFPFDATDDLIDGWCDFVIANLDPGLPAIFGHGNEWWNTSTYATIKFYSYAGLSNFGTQGAGTITFDGTTITNDGSADFTTIFSAGGTVTIAMDHDGFHGGGFAYTVDTNSITATTMDILPGTPDQYEIAATGSVNWYYNPAGSNEYNDRGYVYRSTRAMKRVTDKFTAANQTDRLVRAFETQLTNTNSAVRLFNWSDYWTGPDALDALAYHDVIAVNPYFGSGMMKPPGLNSGNAFKEAVRVAADADDQATYNTLMRDYLLGNPISGVAPLERDIPWIKGRLKIWQSQCAAENLGLWAYEGGNHVISSSSLNADDQSITDHWRPFLYSTEAQELTEAWRDMHIPYMNGPIMKFQTFGVDSYFGAYGMWIGYTQDETNNKEIAVLETIRQMPPFWLSENPPAVVSVADQSWTAGVDPDFTLADYASVNTTTFGGTPPTGMTLNTSTGAITGTGHTAAAQTLYTFTASNASGSVNIPINITVT